MLQNVGCYWLKFEDDQIFHALVDVACRLARIVQQCCARACALLRFSNTQHAATCCNRVAKHTDNVAIKCCDRLAGACKCWANNTALCCDEMLRSFGRGFTRPHSWPMLLTKEYYNYIFFFVKSGYKLPPMHNTIDRARKSQNILMISKMCCLYYYFLSRGQFHRANSVLARLIH